MYGWFYPLAHLGTPGSMAIELFCLTSEEYVPREPDDKKDEDGKEPWQEIARQITAEKDPDRMLKLCRELDEAMLIEEQKKVRQKFRYL